MGREVVANSARTVSLLERKRIVEDFLETSFENGVLKKKGESSKERSPGGFLKKVTKLRFQREREFFKTILKDSSPARYYQSSYQNQLSLCTVSTVIIYTYTRIYIESERHR